MPFEGSNYYYTTDNSFRYDLLFRLFRTVDFRDKYLFIYDDTFGPEHTNFETRFIKTESFPYDLMLEKRQLAADRGLQFRLIFENICEAPSYRYQFKELAESISQRSGIPTTEMIVMSGAQHQWDDPVKNCMVLCIVGAPELFTTPVPFLEPAHHFISLARNSKEHRVLATKEIWDRGLDRYGYCSLGCVELDYLELKRIETILGTSYAHRYPAIIDGMVGGTQTATTVSQNSASDPKISRAFVNLVLETSYDRSVTTNNWNLPFMTEKTSKPFLWYQVPIFLGPVGTLPLIRTVGYDVFDDIIDHSYDSESNPYKRIKMVIDQLECICSWPLEQCKKYHYDNRSRFINNRATAIKFNQQDRFQINKRNIEAAIS